MYRKRFVVMAAGIAACLVLAACGGSTEVSSSTVSTVTDVPSTSSTAPPTSSSSPTTAPPSTAPPVTTAPATSAPAVTTPTTPPAATPPATTPPDPAPVALPATAYVIADDRLAEVDVATGAIVRVLDEFFSGEGVFRGDLRLSPDRSTIWFSEGFEDSWYACDTSIGSYGRVDAATGDVEVVGLGSGVEPSPDGEFIAYLSSSLCLPAPENPDFFVATPNDHVVVRHIATGDERTFFTDTAPDGYDSPSVVIRAIFDPGGNLLIALGDGRLFAVAVDGSSVIQEHPIALSEVSGFPVAATNDAVITLDFGDEGGTDVSSLDAVTGAPTPLASSGAFTAVGVSANDQIVVSAFEPVTVAPGAAVTVVAVDGDPFVTDLDW